ncbi:MAG: hypothetical protein QNJ48_06920 [Desulfobacterales bacterium]|nr:hypothetical protein [Desulfobacterales bacterium]MDJ0883874.1 hypothetical protein [Desulfobacterales bacterium]
MLAIWSLYDSFIFFRVEENEPKEDARGPHTLRVAKPVDEAAPHAAIRCCSALSGAHNLLIAARLTSHCALPDSMMLASWPGFGFGARKLASLKQVRELFPAASAMLGAGQRGIETTDATHFYGVPLWKSAYCISLPLRRLGDARRLPLAGSRGD